jgi:hypothetical protein
MSTKPLNFSTETPEKYPNFRQDQDKDYEQLKISLTTETGEVIEKKIGVVLGKGGSKRAVSLEGDGDQVLLLPNNNKVSNWSVVVKNEVEMSKFCESIGILSSCSRVVKVEFQDSDVVFPAYTSKSFTTLASQGIFVIDAKNSESSMWQEEKHELFTSPLEKISENCWDAVFEPLLYDLAKCVVCNIDIGGQDTINFAVVRKITNSSISIQIKVFAFDFSFSNQVSLEELLANFQKTEFDSSLRRDLKSKVDSILCHLFVVEFGEEYYEKHNPFIKDMYRRLRDKYVEKILKILNEIKKGGKAELILHLHSDNQEPSEQLPFYYVDFKGTNKYTPLPDSDKYYQDQLVFLDIGRGPLIEKEITVTLGKGGSKRAVSLGEDLALLLPNNNKWLFWKKVVEEEVVMSKVCESIGILSPLSKCVKIRIGGCNFFPAYTSKSFSHLASQGLFVIDVKNRGSSTWVEGKHELFQGMEAKLNVENWDIICKPLIEDLAKCIFFSVDTNGNSTINLAVQKKDKSSDASEYQIRVFAFDFSDSSPFPRPIPNVKQIKANPTLAAKEENSTREYLTNTLTTILEELFIVEFGNKYYEHNDSQPTIRALFKNLRERYIEQVLGQLKALTMT